MSGADPLAAAKQRLRTVVGQFELIGLFLCLAVVLATGLATQNSWFRGLVQEKHGEATPADTVRIETVLEQQDPRKTPQEQLEAAYRAAMRAPREPARLAELGARLDAARPTWFRERLRRSLVAGNAAQRARASRLAAGTRNPDYLPTLRGAREFAARTGFDDALTPLDEAIEALTDAPAHR